MSCSTRRRCRCAALVPGASPWHARGVSWRCRPPAARACRPRGLGYGHPETCARSRAGTSGDPCEGQPRTRSRPTARRVRHPRPNWICAIVSVRSRPATQGEPVRRARRPRRRGGVCYARPHRRTPPTPPRPRMGRGNAARRSPRMKRVTIPPCAARPRLEGTSHQATGQVALQEYVHDQQRVYHDHDTGTGQRISRS